mgnify:CR=1 FL=1
MFANVKENQSNQRFRREIPSSNQKNSEKSSKIKNFQKSKIFVILFLPLITFLLLKSAETQPSGRKYYGGQKGTPKTTPRGNPYSQLRDRTHVNIIM